MIPPPLPAPGRAAPLFTVGSVLLLASLLLVTCGIMGVTGFFRLSSEAYALRESAMSSVSGTWNKKIALHAGVLTTSLLRVASRHLKLDADPRAALEAVHGVEVGIYKLQEEPEVVDGNAFLARADKTMSARGWERVVGLSKDRELVAVYCPKRGLTAQNLKCCLAVFHGRDLVIASVKGNPQPLLEIARNHMEPLESVTRCRL